MKKTISLLALFALTMPMSQAYATTSEALSPSQTHVSSDPLTPFPTGLNQDQLHQYKQQGSFIDPNTSGRTWNLDRCEPSGSDASDITWDKVSGGISISTADKSARHPGSTLFRNATDEETCYWTPTVEVAPPTVTATPIVGTVGKEIPPVRVIVTNPDGLKIETCAAPSLKHTGLSVRYEEGTNECVITGVPISEIPQREYDLFVLYKNPGDPTTGDPRKSTPATSTITVTKPTTRYVDENGKQLHPDKDGTHPDNDGVSDVEGYEHVNTRTEDNATINVYRQLPQVTERTLWIDYNTKEEINQPQAGRHLDNEGDDIPGYELVKMAEGVEADENNVITHRNYYVRPQTQWVSDQGEELKPAENGRQPDNEGDDIPGYTLRKTTIDKIEENDTISIIVTNTYSKITIPNTGSSPEPNDNTPQPDPDSQQSEPSTSDKENPTEDTPQSEPKENLQPDPDSQQSEPNNDTPQSDNVASTEDTPQSESKKKPVASGQTKKTDDKPQSHSEPKKLAKTGATVGVLTMLASAMGAMGATAFLTRRRK